MASRSAQFSEAPSGNTKGYKGGREKNHLGFKDLTSLRDLFLLLILPVALCTSEVSNYLVLGALYSSPRTSSKSLHLDPVVEQTVSSRGLWVAARPNSPTHIRNTGFQRMVSHFKHIKAPDRK